MKQIAVYPGSFDPVTMGHLDVLQRALKLFDKVIIAVVSNPYKQSFLNLEERIALIKEATRGISRLQIEKFEGLLVDFLRKKKTNVVIRGLRAVSDFENEFQMALMNRKLAKNVEMVFLMPSEPYTYLSSSIVKEIVRLGGETRDLIPSCVEKKLKEKYSEYQQHCEHFYSKKTLLT